MSYNPNQDPEAGLNDNQAAELLGISAHTLRGLRAGTPPYSGPRFIRLKKRVIYLRKDLIAWRAAEGIEVVMVGDQS